MSGYDIKKLVDAGLSHFWSENYGQIYPTLDRLVKEGLAKKKSERQSGRRQRFVYYITPAGQSALSDWLHEPTDSPVTRNEMQLKFFLSAYTTSRAKRLVEEYRTQQAALLEEYQASESLLRAAIEEHLNVPELEELLDISAATARQRKKQTEVFFLTLRHGILAVEGRLAWCKEVTEYLDR